MHISIRDRRETREDNEGSAFVPHHVLEVGAGKLDDRRELVELEKLEDRCFFLQLLFSFLRGCERENGDGRGRSVVLEAKEDGLAGSRLNACVGEDVRVTRLIDDGRADERSVRGHHGGLGGQRQRRVSRLVMAVTSKAG